MISILLNLPNYIGKGPVISRDFAYHVADPRHWGRSYVPPDSSNEAVGSPLIPSNSNQHFKSGDVVEAMYDFDADMQNELSFREGDKFKILSLCSDGWSKVVSVSNPEIEGLIPDNYFKCGSV